MECNHFDVCLCFFFKDLMSNRGRRDKMKNKEKREAPTLSKAMFTFGKISMRIYEESESEKK
jgi:hypothetical protein